VSRRIVIEDQTSPRIRIAAGTLEAITRAVDHQLHDVAKAWGAYVFDLVDDVRRSGWHVVLLDDADQAGALGYHDVTPDGAPYARVFVRDIVDNGGDLTLFGGSVSSVVSHEVCEMIGDPGANRWANDAAGTLWALELCDAVESDWYAIDGTAVSNFVWPAYFNPFAEGPYDQMGLIAEPFGIAPGGYAIKSELGKVTPIFGDDYPAWKIAGKVAAGARTAARMNWGSGA
jgi:hypothetical protein